MIYQKLKFFFPVLILMLLQIGMSSCTLATLGENVAESELATQPNGSDVDVILMDNGRLSGELLAVHSSSVVILVKNHVNGLKGIHENTTLPAIAEVWFTSARNISATHDSERIVGNGELTSDEKDDVVYLSRFPQGISPQLMSDLLEAYNQEDLITINDE